MVLVQVLGQPELLDQEIGADLDGRFPHPALEGGGAFDDQHAQRRVLLQKQDRRRRARERAADDRHIVRPAVRFLRRRRPARQEVAVDSRIMRPFITRCPARLKSFRVP